MTRREITRFGWTAQDAARAERMRTERMRTERAGTDPVAEAEVERIQWEGQPTPWMAMFAPRVTVVDGVTHFTRPGFARPHDEESP